MQVTLDYMSMYQYNRYSNAKSGIIVKVTV